MGEQKKDGQAKVKSASKEGQAKSQGKGDNAQGEEMGAKSGKSPDGMRRNKLPRKGEGGSLPRN
jgi:hypothetical protein